MNRIRAPRSSTVRLARLVSFAALALVLLVPGLDVRPARAQVSLGAPRPRPDDVAVLQRDAEAHPHDAGALAAYARALIARGRVEDRLRAQDLLKRAVALAPEDIDHRLTLADLYTRQGYLTLARRQLAAALKTPGDVAPAYQRLGKLALGDWVKFQRSGSLDTARRYWQEAARRAPTTAAPWLGLGVLALLDGDAEGAVAAGREVRTSTHDPSPLERGEAYLLEGAGFYGLGRAESADSAFRAALTHLAGPVRDRLLDITPAAADLDTTLLGSLQDSGARARFLERFWKSRDPDLTTGLNEVQLEMLSRGALAYFLFYDPKQRSWDERGNYLVRYGPPDSTDYNPVWSGGGVGVTNRLVWHYWGLGFDILFEERFLNHRYDIPWSMTDVVDFSPDLDFLDARVASGELTEAGRGVFRALLPGARRLRGWPDLAMFRRVAGFDPRISAAATMVTDVGARAGRAGRLEAYIAVEGGPDATLLGIEAVVLEDSTFREMGRARTTDFAWCLSETIQVAQLNFDVPPGAYVVGISVRDSIGKAAGTWRLHTIVPPFLPGRVEISDLELACSREEGTRSAAFSKIEDSVVPNPSRIVPRNQPFGLYFEIYNLVSDAAGRSKVDIEYTIRSTRKDRRMFLLRAFKPKKNDPVVNVERSDEIPGRARFQYVSADLSAQPPGPYRIEVTATDGTTGAKSTKSLEFELVD